MLMLGRMAQAGQGGAIDEVRATRWFIKAYRLLKPRADADDSEAAGLLAKMYEQGLGVAADKRQSLKYKRQAQKKQCKAVMQDWAKIWREL